LDLHNVTVKLNDRTLRMRASFPPGKPAPFLNSELIEALRQVGGVEDARQNLHFRTVFIVFTPKTAIQKKGMFNSLSAVFARFGYKLES